MCVGGVGAGVNFALLKENKYSDPHFFILFSKGKIIVYEIKTKL